MTPLIDRISFFANDPVIQVDGKPEPLISCGVIKMIVERTARNKLSLLLLLLFCFFTSFSTLHGHDDHGLDELLEEEAAKVALEKRMNLKADDMNSKLFFQILEQRLEKLPWMKNKKVFSLSVGSVYGKSDKEIVGSSFNSSPENTLKNILQKDYGFQPKPGKRYVWKDCVSSSGTLLRSVQDYFHHLEKEYHYKKADFKSQLGIIKKRNILATKKENVSKGLAGIKLDCEPEVHQALLKLIKDTNKFAKKAYHKRKKVQEAVYAKMNQKKERWIAEWKKKDQTVRNTIKQQIEEYRKKYFVTSVTYTLPSSITERGYDKKHIRNRDDIRLARNGRDIYSTGKKRADDLNSKSPRRDEICSKYGTIASRCDKGASPGKTQYPPSRLLDMLDLVAAYPEVTTFQEVSGSQNYKVLRRWKRDIELFYERDHEIFRPDSGKTLLFNRKKNFLISFPINREKAQAIHFIHPLYRHPVLERMGINYDTETPETTFKLFEEFKLTNLRLEHKFFAQKKKRIVMIGLSGETVDNPSLRLLIRFQKNWVEPDFSWNRLNRHKDPFIRESDLKIEEIIIYPSKGVAFNSKKS